MDSQKRENLLNLSLNVSETEREKTLELGVGFDPNTKLWEVIVKYTGDIQKYQSERIKIVPLLGGYAIITLPEAALMEISQYPEIAFIEKPKRLFFTIARGKTASCVNSLQTGNSYAYLGRNLFGQGVLIGIPDSGIDYYHMDFRNADGSTRILRLWDQTLVPREGEHSPEPYGFGVEYTEEQMNAALSAESKNEGYEIVPSRDLSGHGTGVAGIAAGNGRAGGGRYRGMAPESQLIIVKLGNPRPDSFPRTTELMQAVDYIVHQAVDKNMPVAVNISFGNTYGSHDGTALLETYLNQASDYGKAVIVAGSGNEGAAAGHTSGILKEGEVTDIELSVSPYESTLNLQIWKIYADQFTIELIKPDGTVIGPLREALGPQHFTIGGTELLLYYGEPSPYSRAQEIFIEFIPVRSYVDTGIWTIRFHPTRIVQGDYHLWLPSASALNIGTQFSTPNPDITLTIPSTASQLITVGAYNAALNSYAEFSGRGFTRVTNQIKPDIVAPGVGIMTAAPNGGYGARTGTSFAAPFVTGAAALLMEWGIIQNNDPYLYGEKVKAYLIRGAQHLPGFSNYPNPQVGWGTLCVADSLPRE